MQFLAQVFGDALAAFTEFGPELRTVVVLTLLVSGLSTVIAVVIGVPLGAILALERFPGSAVLRTGVDVGMGLPPVLAGLFVLLLFLFFSEKYATFSHPVKTNSQFVVVVVVI